MEWNHLFVLVKGAGVHLSRSQIKTNEGMEIWSAQLNSSSPLFGEFGLIYWWWVIGGSPP